MNPTHAPLQVVEGWLPHGRFFAERQTFAPPLTLPAGACATIDRAVRYVAEPGEAIENAFLILRVRWCEQSWRVLTRLRVACLAPSAVTLAVEVVTTHPVGFAHGTLDDGAARIR
jgi:hypothetical protein